MILFTFSPKKNVQIVFSGSGEDILDSFPRELCLPGIRFVQAQQVHGADIARCDAILPEVRQGVDGLITDLQDTALVIRTADCLPIMLFDRKGTGIAAVHAGLRGTMGNIAGKAVSRLQEWHKANINDIIVYMGPGIQKCCYEVDDPVMEQIRHYPFINKIVSDSSKKGHYMLDLPGFNYNLLLAAGIPAENINNMKLCTACRPDMFYSYRARRDKSRMCSFIVRKG